ncbi:MAG: DNA mismatch repair protein MutL, partial [Gammaproteobacteria bacterium]|nr:DNA mismatch repair protein MutL [Gammaproteobacteria bacterium]
MVQKRIGKLDSALADQIAAGEVVERPASIVKEVVENSLDAGSKNIDISVSGGGLKSIYVSDDGYGIHEADLTLAIQRHATSKIRKSEDLLSISTLGFRGEALASIASVSRFKLSSRSDQSESGWMISSAGDSKFSKEPIAHNRGTTVHASELFFNVPVRRKFLKSERAENRQIEAVVKKISLANMAVAFS